MKSLKLSEAGCSRLIAAFKHFCSDIPASYKEMCRNFLDKSCIPLFIRKIPSCMYCRLYFDDTRQYCANCLNYHKQSALYKKCQTKGCICSKSVEEWEGKHDASQLMCSHVREPTYDYVYYIPPIAIICDLIHNHLYDLHIGRTEDSIIDICKYCLQLGSHSPYVSLNTLDICKEYGMVKASEYIQSLH